jgi:hypothetical protein
MSLYTHEKGPVWKPLYIHMDWDGLPWAGMACAGLALLGLT